VDKSSSNYRIGPNHSNVIYKGTNGSGKKHCPKYRRNIYVLRSLTKHVVSIYLKTHIVSHMKGSDVFAIISTLYRKRDRA